MARAEALREVVGAARGRVVGCADDDLQLFSAVALWTVGGLGRLIRLVAAGLGRAVGADSNPRPAVDRIACGASLEKATSSELP